LDCITGNKWTAISREFGDRTDNACKNRWHALVKKRPELLEVKVPISAVGVRKGTKTHSLIIEDSSLTDPSAAMDVKSQSMAPTPGSGSAALPATPFDVPSVNPAPAQPSTVQDYLAGLLLPNGHSMGNLIGMQRNISSLPNLPQGTNLDLLGSLFSGAAGASGTGGPGQQFPTMFTERNAQTIYTLLSKHGTDAGLFGPGSRQSLTGMPSMDFSDSFQKNLGSLLVGHPGASGGQVTGDDHKASGRTGVGDDDKDVQNKLKAGLSAQQLQQLLSFNVIPGMLAAGGVSSQIGETQEDGKPARVAKPSANVAAIAQAVRPDMATVDSQQLLDVTFTNRVESLDASEKLVLDNLLVEEEDAGAKRKREDRGEGGEGVATEPLV
jgi:hypothetical protein